MSFADGSSGLEFLILDLAEREDRKRERVRKNALKKQKWDAFELSDKDFIKTFRLSKGLVQSLISELVAVMETERRNDALSIKSKVLVALAFFASGSYQTLVGQSFFNAVSQPTVSRAIFQVTDALNSPTIFHKYVNFPINRMERNKIKLSFYNKYQMPGIIGCIDGTHIRIVKPINHEERYINRKGFHSINVMIICDSEMNIMCIDPSHPGSTHDSVIWGEHPLNNYLAELYRNGEIVHLLGDSGYPLRETLLTPYLNATQNSPEEHYYNVHVSVRNVVERCIGLLKARFRCLLAARSLHYNPVMAGKIVNACAVLHNIANKARVPEPLHTSEEQNVETNNDIEQNFRTIASDAGPSRYINIDLQQGRIAQQAMIHRLLIENND